MEDPYTTHAGTERYPSRIGQAGEWGSRGSLLNWGAPAAWFGGLFAAIHGLFFGGRRVL